MSRKMSFGRISAILASLIISGASVVRVEGQTAILSDVEKADIVESLLKLEIETQRAEFKSLRTLSLENIRSVPTERITRHGFSLMTVEQIEESRRHHVIRYLAIRSFHMKNGIIVVRVSHVVEGRPCFSPSFSEAQSFYYEFQNGFGGWVGRLVKSALPFSLGRRLAGKP